MTSYLDSPRSPISGPNHFIFGMESFVTPCNQPLNDEDASKPNKAKGAQSHQQEGLPPRFETRNLASIANRIERIVPQPSELCELDKMRMMISPFAVQVRKEANLSGLAVPLESCWAMCWAALASVRLDHHHRYLAYTFAIR